MAAIALRDDAGWRSLSTNEAHFIRECALQSLRTDGRAWKQARAQQMRLTRGDRRASVDLSWGASTRVTSTCQGELVAPFLDRPSEGILQVSVDLSPSASSSFRQTNPVVAGGGGGSGSAGRSQPMDAEQKRLSNRILRTLERLLATAIDTEALCVTPGQWVWKLTLALTVVDAGGNLLDASVLAAMAALRHYRRPHVQLDGPVPQLTPATLKEPTPLPLHHTPLSVSFGLLAPPLDAPNQSVILLLDPNDREELILDGHLTLALTAHGELCGLDVGGCGCEVKVEHIRASHEIAAAVMPHWSAALDACLQQADETAKAERLHRLQQEQNAHVALPPLPAPPVEGMPYYQYLDAIEVDAENIDQAAQQVADEAEEAYRRQALDYNLAHQPSKIREAAQPKARLLSSSSLLAAMLQSVRPVTEATTKESAVQAPAPELQAIQSKPTAPLPPPKDMATEPMQNEPKDGGMDSDEEETTMQLTSEFDGAAPKPPKAVPAPATDGNEEDDDADDLTAAIKSKKKKKKKK